MEDPLSTIRFPDRIRVSNFPSWATTSAPHYITGMYNIGEINKEPLHRIDVRSLTTAFYLDNPLPVFQINFFETHSMSVHAPEMHGDGSADLRALCVKNPA